MYNVDYNYEISLSFWEFHEALFNLTTWPKDIIQIGMSDEIYEQTKRGVIRVPNERLNSKLLSQKQRLIKKELKKSILNGELQARFYNLNFLKEYYGTNTSYLLSPIKVIIWTLLKGFILPEKLQKLGLYQQTNIKLFKQFHHDRIKNQIVAQYLLQMNPKFNKSQLCNHDWMKLYGTSKKVTDKEKKAIRRAINRLFISKGKKERYYCFKPISEIILKSEGNNFYHFPLFKTAIETIAQIKIKMLGRTNFLELTEEDFLKEFFEDKIVQAYLNIVLDMMELLLHKKIFQNIQLKNKIK